MEKHIIRYKLYKYHHKDKMEQYILGGVNWMLWVVATTKSMSHSFVLSALISKKQSQGLLPEVGSKLW